MQGKKNYIYQFYEQVSTNDQGQSQLVFEGPVRSGFGTLSPVTRTRTVHSPTYSGGIRRTLADSGRLWRTPVDSGGLNFCDMGQICMSSPDCPVSLLESAGFRPDSVCQNPPESTSLADSSRLHQTPPDSSRVCRSLPESAGLHC